MKALLVAAAFISVVVPAAGRADTDDDGDARTLSAKLEEVYDGTRTDSCDQKQANMRKAVASRIDRHFEERPNELGDETLKSYMRNNVAVPMGKMTILVRKKPSKAPAGKYVKDPEPDSWAAAARRLKWYNFWRRHWADNYGLVSSTLLDDENRLVYDVPQPLAPEKMTALMSAYLEILVCRKNPDCKTDDLSRSAKAFLESMSLDRLDIISLRSVVEAKFVHFLPRRQSGVTAAPDGALVVKMDAGDMRGHEPELESLFLNRWRKAGLKIRMDWTTQVMASAILVPKLVMDLQPGDRAYVNVDMHLPPIEEAATFAHEFGHILGLADEYYTVYDPKRCQYDIYSDDANIMSDYRGDVQPIHVKLLRALYF